MEFDIISQKAGALGEKIKPDFGNPGVGNEISSTNSRVMGLDDDVMAQGQSLLPNLPSFLADGGGGKLEYPIDVSGNPAYAATVRFQILEYTTSTPGKTQKKLISGTTDNIKSQEITKPKVEDDPGIDAFGGLGTSAYDTNTFANDAGASTFAGDASDFAPGVQSFKQSDFSDFSGVNMHKAKQDAVKENAAVTASGGEQNIKLGFFPKPNSPTILMYYPLSQAFLDGVSYGDAELGSLGGTAQTATEAGTGAGAAVMNQLGNTFSQIAGTILRGELNLSTIAKTEAARLTASRTLGKLPLGLGAAATLANRISINPNVRKLFNGVAVREFAFTFKFIATSPGEAETVQKIIKLFRKELYPKAFRVSVGSEASVALGYNFPNAFKIKFQFKGSENHNIPKILPCYLRTASHTINGTGGSFRNDGKPNEIDLSLSFVEHRALDQKDIEEGY
jgi:hypothetical protein